MFDLIIKTHFVYIHRLIGPVGRVFAYGQGLVWFGFFV